MAILVVFAGAALVIRGSAFGVTPTSYDSDADRDGAITISDALVVLGNIGQLVATPTAVPSFGTTDDVLLADQVTVADVETRWLGSYRPALCETASIFVSAQSFRTEPGAIYTLLIGPSEDGLSLSGSPVVAQANIGAGAIGTWISYRFLSSHGDNFNNYYQEPLTEYTLVGVLAHADMKVFAEVHCARKP